MAKSVKFDRLGDVTAHEAVRIIREGGAHRGDQDVTDLNALDNEETYAVAVLHPGGGRIYIHHGMTAQFAVMSAAELRSVLSAWVDHESEES